MSRNAKISPATKPKATENKKPYCKVCFDAGKHESEYTSHWVRSLPDHNGKTAVLCPTLLSTECRYCYELGHTTKFCPVLEKNNNEREHKAARALKADRCSQAAAAERPKPEAKKPCSIFEVLRDYSVPEEKVKIVKPVENFPVLAGPSKKVEAILSKPKPEVKTGWAAIVAKPKEDDFIKQIDERSLLKSFLQSALKPKSGAKPATPVTKTQVVAKAWADSSDSEDDDKIPVSSVYYRSHTSFVKEEIDEEW
jgi:hypothetical protein